MTTATLLTTASAVVLLVLAISSGASAQSIESATLAVEAADKQVTIHNRDVPPEAASIVESRVAPFGASLFSGGFSGSRHDGVNPYYLLQPGDSVSVRIWGATEFDESLRLDPQGNIFIPSVGPIALGGIANKDVNDRVRSAVSRVYTDQVQVYTSLDRSQPVTVYVTGFVKAPGLYSGVPASSILHYLELAGGIDAERGSYRAIRVVRDSGLIGEVDLYEFLLDGQLPPLQFENGDTIVVEQRLDAIGVDGDVPESARFELHGHERSGRTLVRLAQPGPSVSHVGVTGIRGAKPFSVYLPLAEFEAMSLASGDSVTFKADRRQDIITVDIEGSHRGPSRFAVPHDTSLAELLDYVEIDPVLADPGAVSIRRETIAQRQKAALEDSLRRLESRYLTASSQTDQEAAIRASEAKLISQFVESARRVEPNGRLVVAREGKVADILLRDGDTITIPSRSDSVLLSGEVLVSQAVLHREGLRARDYIELSGGFSSQADTRRLIVIHPNGQVSSDENPRVGAGDEIIVLPRVPVKNLQLTSTVVDILYKVAIAASVAVQL